VDNLALLLGETPRKTSGQERDVVDPVVKGRQVDRNDVQPVVEVFPKVAVANLFQKVSVRGRQYSHVDMKGRFSPYAFELLSLKNSQEFDLGRWDDFANFIQKNVPRAPAQSGRLFGDGSGEGALFMSEEFAFEQRCRKG